MAIVFRCICRMISVTLSCYLEAESLKPAGTAGTPGEIFGHFGEIFDENIPCAVKFSNLSQI